VSLDFQSAILNPPASAGGCLVSTEFLPKKVARAGHRNDEEDAANHQDFCGEKIRGRLLERLRTEFQFFLPSPF